MNIEKLKIIVSLLLLASISSGMLKAACCGGIEYDPATQSCCDERIPYTTATQGCCENFLPAAITYNLADGDCCGTTYVEKGHCCGGLEFDADTKCCMNGGIVESKKPGYAELVEKCNGGIDDPNEEPSSNGCTGVPNTPPGSHGVSFETACNAHDVCYDTCKTPQATCDTAFLNNMRALCLAAHSGDAAKLADCYAAAQVYYTSVDLVGIAFYAPAQQVACRCCP